MATLVEVVTRDLSDLDSAPAVVVIDHEEKNHRVWLGRHCFWAMRNNHSVFTTPTEKEVTFVDKNK